MAKRLSQLCLSLVLIATSIQCSKKEKAQIENSDQCTFSAATASFHIADCQQLIFREINGDTTHPDYYKPYFDQNEIEELLAAIQAIKDLNIPATDSIFLKHQIHVSPDTGLNQVYLEVDTSYSTGRNLMNSKPSGNSRFDSLISALNFSIIYINHRYTEVILDSPTRYNIIAVTKLFETFPFVTDTDVNAFSGYPDDIRIERTSGITTFDFSHGWGDCLAGCIFQKHWIFEVDENCNAQFIRSYMD